VVIAVVKPPTRPVSWSAQIDGDPGNASSIASVYARHRHRLEDQHGLGSGRGEGGGQGRRLGGRGEVAHADGLEGVVEGRRHAPRER
jgi:hypothetical protein